MKYAKFSDDFLSYFRLDDNGETLVLTDKRGYTQAVELLPYEERPQGDLISRETLKKAFAKITYIRFTADMGQGGYDMFSEKEIEDIIDKAPTVEPERSHD